MSKIRTKAISLEGKVFIGGGPLRTSLSQEKIRMTKIHHSFFLFIDSAISLVPDGQAREINIWIYLLFFFLCLIIIIILPTCNEQPLLSSRRPILVRPFFSKWLAWMAGDGKLAYFVLSLKTDLSARFNSNLHQFNPFFLPTQKLVNTLLRIRPNQLVRLKR